MRSLVIFTLSVVVALGGSALAAPIAQAHTPNPIACEIAWDSAPAGMKFTAQQRCIAAQWRHTCLTHQRTVPSSVTVKGLYLKPGRRATYSPHWRNQRHVIAWIVNEGLRRHLPRKLIITALATGTQESSLRELAYGDSSSLGPFQLLDLHGTARERISIEFSGAWFYNGIQRTYRRNPSLSIIDLAHSQQRSRYPAAVGDWIPEATRTVKLVLGPRCQVA
jgi:hypothetical protein